MHLDTVRGAHYPVTDGMFHLFQRQGAAGQRTQHREREKTKGDWLWFATGLSRAIAMARGRQALDDLRAHLRQVPAPAPRGSGAQRHCLWGPSAASYTHSRCNIARRTPRWPVGLTSAVYSCTPTGNARANLHLLGRPNTFLANVSRLPRVALSPEPFGARTRCCATTTDGDGTGCDNVTMVRRRPIPRSCLWCVCVLAAHARG